MKRSFILAVVLTAVTSFEAMASECKVYFTLPCRAAAGNSYFAPLQQFRDVDIGANINTTRCLERAAEYKQWCGSPLEVWTMFVSEGRSSIAAFASRDGKTYITDGIGRFTGFSK